MLKPDFAMLKLLIPGVKLKRWLLLALVGLVPISVGLAYLFVELYRTVPLPEVAGPLTLQFLPRPVRAAILIVMGAAVVGAAIWRFNRTIVDAVRPVGSESLVDVLYRNRSRQRGPKIVAIGGGTGLSTMLRGIKLHTDNVTAIVTVADDGGSSGRLRRELGVLPPGDFRNCIVALAEAEPLMSRHFQYRFGPGSGLDGHSFGNLFIVAMSGITGNFEEAIRESSRVLAVRGQILPSTLENVTLCAELVDLNLVQGESNISQSTSPIRRVYLEPAHPPAYPEAVKAILEADLVVVGPGSLYTSVLPNLMVEGIRRALMASDAVKVYVCNVATQRGETDGFGVREHFEALLRHLPGNPFDFAIINDNVSQNIPPEWQVSAVHPNGLLTDPTFASTRLLAADVVDPHSPLRHDPEKLADVLMKALSDRSRQMTPVDLQFGQQATELIGRTD
jgi:uncharacterized cofD-like protein